MKNYALTLEDLGIRIPFTTKIKQRWNSLLTSLNSLLISLRIKKKSQTHPPYFATQRWELEDETLGIRRNIVTQQSSSPGVRAEPRTTTFYG